MKNNNLSLTTILVSLFLIAAPSVFADDGHGRLEDGRAFRKDADGNTMVDYIAELELEVDSLRRQVQGLQGERDNVELKLASKSPDGCQIPLKEKNLIGGSASATCPKCEEKICQTVSKDCSSEVTTAAESCTKSSASMRNNYEDIIARKEGKIAELNIALKSARQSQEVQAASVSQDGIELQNVKAQLQRVQSQLADSIKENGKIKASVQNVKAPAVQNNKEYIDEINSLRSEIEEKDGQITNFIEKERRAAAVQPVKAPVCPELKKDCSNEIAPLSVALERRTQDVESLRKENAELRSVRAANQDTVRASYHPETKTMQGTPEHDPLTAARGVVLTEINVASTAAIERDTVYKTYKQKPTAVSFTPGDARSDKGNTLTMLKSKVSDAASMRELSLVRREVAEVKSKIDFDIGMMKRLMALHQ